MIKPRFSQFWYRVENLKPRLCSHLDIRRHLYRGQVWYVINDAASGKLHRFTANAYTLIGLMDGVKSVRQLWEIGEERLRDYAPTQDEVISLLGQLHGADLLQCDIPPDAVELFRRHRSQKKAKRAQTFLSPLAIRIPLYDPDRFLARLLPFFRPFFGRLGFAAWLAFLTMTLVMAGQHWQELSSDVLDRVLTPQNLLLVWLLFPLVKLFHELGHGLLAKAWGCEVHEIGIMLLVFTPVPYIDVSASSGFVSKWRRVAVASGGMMFELVLASCALAVWINVEPGLARNCAYNVLIVSGLSTLLFNSNPLIRYDGYYILSDALELPNLSQRANRYLQYLVTAYAFGQKNQEAPAESWSERAWYLFYAPASWLYRLLIIAGIGLFLAQKFLVIGLLVTAWSLLSMLALPMFRGLKYLFANAQLRENRRRAVTVAFAAMAGLAALLALIPMPLRTMAEGVVWLPEDAFIRAGTGGFVKEILRPAGTMLQPEETVLLLEEPSLLAKERVALARIEELRAQYRAEQVDNRVRAEIIERQLAQEEAKLERVRGQLRDLVVRGRAQGKLVLPQPEDLPGRFVRHGETVGYVFPDTQVIVRVVVPQEQAGMVRAGIRRAEARLAHNIHTVFPATMVREVPSGLEHLPSKTLSVAGGGTMVVDPREQSGTKTFARTFQFDLQLPMPWTAVNVGDRVYLRFDHKPEPLAHRWWRALRQLFLTKLDV